MNSMPEIIKTLADTAVNYSTLNTVMFVGLVIAFSLWGLLFFANGCAIYVHDIYDMYKTRWYKKSSALCKALILIWSIIYVICFLFSSIGIAEFAQTYIFAFMCTTCISIGASLTYNFVWYAFILPYRCFFNKKRK